MSFDTLSSLILRKSSLEIRLASLLDEVRSEINQVYKDISGSHFQSAIQAIETASISKNPEQEIRNAISHLRDSYNIIDSLLNKKTKKSFLLFISYTEVQVKKVGERMILKINLSKISATISYLYTILDETIASKKWKEISLNNFDEYYQRDYGYNCDFLYVNDQGKSISYMDLSDTYKDKYVVITTKPVGSMAVTSTDVRLSPAGESYVKKYRRKQRERLTSFFSEIQNLDKYR